MIKKKNIEKLPYRKIRAINDSIVVKFIKEKF
jgi:sporulation protein YlmC with PRC-barrel domain